MTEIEAIYRNKIARSRRVVIKIGTSVITYDSGKLNLDRLESLVREIAQVHNSGIQVVVVTSGAIGAGFGRMGFHRPAETIPEKQALAAIGQGILMHIYEKLFSEYAITVAQVLLTKDDLVQPHRQANSRATLLHLLNWQVIPIINENDTVSVDEIRFGDNDMLSAMVTELLQADTLIILTDTDGFYTADPRKDPEAKLIPLVNGVTKDIEKLAGGTDNLLGTGGMASKLMASRIANASGAPVVIANGLTAGTIRNILSGKQVGTLLVNHQPDYTTPQANEAP